MQIEVLMQTTIDVFIKDGELINSETGEKIKDREVIKIFLEKVMDKCSDEYFEKYYVFDRIDNLCGEGMVAEGVTLAECPGEEWIFEHDYIIMRVTVSGEEFYYSCKPEYSEEESVIDESPTISYYNYEMIDNAQALSIISNEIDRLDGALNSLKSFVGKCK